MEEQTALNILVTGYYEQKNLGDDLFVEIAQYIFPNKIFKNNINRIEYIKIEDINAQSLFVQCDKLILFGGEVLNDYFLDRILEFKLKNHNTEFYAIGVSINQNIKDIQNKLNIFDRIIFRNKSDYNYFKNIYGEYCNYAPDLVFLNNYKHNINLFSKHKNVGFFLAQPLYYSLNNTTKNIYIKQIQKAINYWLERNYNIYFFPMCCNSKNQEDDIIIIDKVIEPYTITQKTKFKYFINNLSIIKNLPKMKYNLCWRFHSVVLSIKFNIPFIALGSTPKVKNILIDSNLEDLEYNINNILDGCNYIKNNKKIIKNKLVILNKIYSKQVKTIYLNPINYNDKRMSAPFLINKEDFNKIVKYIINNYKKLSSEYDNNYNTELILYTLTRTINSEYYYGLSNKIQYGIDNLVQDIQWLINDLINKNNIYFFMTAASILNRAIIYNKNKLGINMDYINQFDMQGLHRSGWCYVLDNLKDKQNSNSIMCDFYVDRTFHWNNIIYSQLKIIPYTQPWIGFIHHTMDEHYSDFNTTSLFNNKLFLTSLKHCKGLIVLSAYLKNQIVNLMESKNINISVYNLVHPTEFVDNNNLFTMDKFKNNNNKKIIQIGAWMREIYAIFKLDIDDTLKIQKYALVGKKMESYYNLSDTNNNSYISRDKKKRKVNKNNTVHLISYLENNMYDELLRENLVFLKLIDASAVNTLIECVVRNTPIIINKLPAVVEILGDKYPLYYDNLDEVKSLLTMKNIENAHNYLKKLDKHKLHINTFIKEFDMILKDIN